MLSLPDPVNVQLQSGKVSKKSFAAFRGVMICAVGSRVTVWSPMVYACDSSLDGYSVQSSVWAVTVVCETGLRKEGIRWENLVQRGLDSKALRQWAIWLERTANLGGMLQGDTSELIVICWNRGSVKDGSPTKPSKKYVLSSWIFQHGNVLSTAEGFTKISFVTDLEM